MLQFSIPAGKSGMAMQRCIEKAVKEMESDLDGHENGERLYPEDVEGCTARVKALWDEIHGLRNRATFSLMNAVELGSSYELVSEDPLMHVARNAILLEFIDQELGDDTSSSISKVMGYILYNPISYFPDRGARIHH